MRLHARKPARAPATGRHGARPLQIREQRRREVGKLGAIIPYYTGTVALMTASPILASVAAFTVYAFIAPASDFSPARIFSSLALFSLLKPALEGLPFVFVEVRSAAQAAPPGARALPVVPGMHLHPSLLPCQVLRCTLLPPLLHLASLCCCASRSRALLQACSGGRADGRGHGESQAPDHVLHAPGPQHRGAPRAPAGRHAAAAVRVPACCHGCLNRMYASGVRVSCA